MSGTSPAILYLVRKRGQLLAHIQNSRHQCNLPEPTRKIISQSNREGVTEKVLDLSVRKSIEVDFELVAHHDRLIRDLELCLVRTAKKHDPQSFHRLRTLPGVGKILALTLLENVAALSSRSSAPPPSPEITDLRGQTS